MNGAGLGTALAGEQRETSPSRKAFRPSHSKFAAVKLLDVEVDR